MVELVSVRGHDWNTEWPSVPSAYINKFYETFPFLGYASEFERNFDANGEIATWTRFFEKYVVILSLVYVVAVFGGIKYMKNREAFQLSFSLKAWNLFLAVFSIYGALRLTPAAFYVYFTTENTAYMCAPGHFSFGSGVQGFVAYMFMISKVFELIDTAFLILRKKPVGFLHWFHHATVLVFTWDAFANQQGGGVLFMAMNYFVHAVMYTYYYLAACGKPPKWGKAVTIVQILQMVMGTYWSVRLVQLYRTYGTQFALPASALTWEGFTAETVKDHGCAVTGLSVYCGLAMYAVYLYLFCEFFVKRYVLGGSKKKTVKKE